MFGVLRTLLALFVMASHLIDGPAPLGHYPVFGFYVISGYLMTRIMQERYRYSAAGRSAFAVNRCLRIFPQYWAACGLTLLLILLLGSDAVRQYNPVMFVPPNWQKALMNLLLFFPAWYAFDIRPRLVPPTWAVSVEIIFYALIALGLSKSRFRVKVWLGLSFAYVAGSYLVGAPWEDRYNPVPAASLPFAVGAAVYFLSQDSALQQRLARSGLTARRLLLLILFNGTAATLLIVCRAGQWADIGTYINLALFGALVLQIALGDNPFGLSVEADKQIGDLSYPIYLYHWQAGLIVTTMLYGEAFHEASVRGFLCLAISYVFVVVLASLSVRLIDAPIERLRTSIKRRQANQTGANLSLPAALAENVR